MSTINLNDNFVAVGNLELGGPPPRFADERTFERDTRAARRMLGPDGQRALLLGPRVAQPASEPNT